MNIDARIARAAKNMIVASGLLVAGVAWAANPIDLVSNPEGLAYPEVHMKLPDYDEPFQRNGVMFQPQRLHQLKPGMTAGEVVTLLGRPLNEGTAAQSRYWDYNFTFTMPESEHYIVCQYKVVFDQDNLLEKGFWRRRQCLDIADGGAK